MTALVTAPKVAVSTRSASAAALTQPTAYEEGAARAAVARATASQSLLARQSVGVTAEPSDFTVLSAALRTCGQASTGAFRQ